MNSTLWKALTVLIQIYLVLKVREEFSSDPFGAC